MSRPFRPLAVLVAAVVFAGCSGGGEATADRPAEAPSTTVAVASTGCGRAPDVELVDGESRPGDVEQLLDVDGNERLYRLGVPASYDPDVPAPLVLNLHGSGSNAEQASVYGDVPRAAAERGMITVAAEALGGNWELAAEGADGDFLDQLLDDVESRYCVDPDRVYIVGMSLGAWKAAVTACASEGRFAALSLVTVEVFPGTCEPMPVVAFHGRADRTVPYGDGGEVDRAETRLRTLPGAEQNMANWAASGGCGSEPEVEAIGDDVELRRYPGCDDGVSVELYSIDGGGHTWPGSDINLGPPEWTTQTIDATELTLDFFEAHPRSAREPR